MSQLQWIFNKIMKKIFNLNYLTWILLIIALLTVTSCVTINPGQKYQSFGPQSLNIGTGSGDFKFNPLKMNDRVEFNFTVTGAPVSYSVHDPIGNTVLIGRGAFRYVQRGRGHFTASKEGDYTVHFISSGLGDQSVITLNYTIFYAR